MYDEPSEYFTNPESEYYENPAFFEATEFLVDNVAFDENSTAVGGRLISGKVSLNDVFNFVFDPVIISREDHYRRVGRQNEKQTHIQVEAIEAFRQRMEWIDSGDEARIWFTSQEKLGLHPGQVLAIVYQKADAP